MAADSKSKMMKRTISRPTFVPVWVGLLVLGSLTSAITEAAEPDGELSVQMDDGLLSVAAVNVPLTDIMQEVAAVSDLRLVQHLSLDRAVSLEITRQPLADALGEVLADESYQLYAAMPSDTSDETIPGTLWIFSKGSVTAPAGTAFLEAVLYKGSFREKKEAIRELRRLGTPIAVQALSLALTDENERIRAAGFEALERIGSEEAMVAIASAALDSDPWVRAEAITALASDDDESSAKYLSIAMDDPDPRVRMAVIEALADVPYGSVPDQQAVAALNRALKDENTDVRMRALESLEEIGGDVAFQALMQAKLDQDARIAETAEDSLSSLREAN